MGKPAGLSQHRWFNEINVKETWSFSWQGNFIVMSLILSLSSSFAGAAVHLIKYEQPPGSTGLHDEQLRAGHQGFPAPVPNAKVAYCSFGSQSSSEQVVLIGPDPCADRWVQLGQMMAIRLVGGQSWHGHLGLIPSRPNHMKHAMPIIYEILVAYKLHDKYRRGLNRVQDVKPTAIFNTCIHDL